MASGKTFYEILDVPADAPTSEVEAGYQRAMELFSPDSLAGYALFSPDEAVDARREIQTAYAVLREPAARSAYDAELAQAQDKSAVTVTFSMRWAGPGLGATSVSDAASGAGSVLSVAQAPVSMGAEATSRRQNTGRAVRIAAPVEDTPTLPAAETPPLLQRPAAEVEKLALLPPIPAAPLPVAAAQVLTPLPPPPAPLLPAAEATAAQNSWIAISLAPTQPPPVAASSSVPAPAVPAPAPSPPPAPAPVSMAPPAPAPPPVVVTPPVPQAPRFRRVTVDDGAQSRDHARPLQPALASVTAGSAHGHPELLALPEDGEINGSVLQRLREARGIPLRTMSDVTKVSVHYLQAMEANDISELPTRVYLRGFLIQYARALKVNADRLSNGYLAFAERYRSDVR